MSLFQRLAALKEKLPDNLTGAAEIPEPSGLPEGREVVGPLGSCYVIERRYPGRVILPTQDPGQLLEDLRLLRGIGPVTDEALRCAGCRDISGLTTHPRWGEEARAVIELIRRGDIPALKARGAADYQWLGYFSSGDLVFLDIETTGLWANQPLFLVGLLWEEDAGLMVRQFLARRIGEEKAVLGAVLAEVPRFRVVVTYNGKQFDIPYIEGRSVAHRMFYRFPHQQLDLLYHARRHYRGRLPDCRLVTMEEHLLGFQRQGDIPGYLIPQTYLRYTRSQDPALIRDILEHNALDLVALARLIHLLVRQVE